MLQFGLTLHLNHFWLEFLSPFSLHLGLSLGRSNRNGCKWWNWGVPCCRCQSQVTFESGIICANYGKCRGHFLACDGAWCASYFTAHPLDYFEIKMPRDFNGTSLAELEDEIRFREARPGDHFCIPFQCPNCQSRNIQGRSIDNSFIDNLVFECMVVQATLDAFWSRASKTVWNHVREVRNMARYGRMFQYPPMPVLGPWPLYTHLGMEAAVMVLMQSMEKERGGGTVKYGTARKACATLTVLWKSSPLGGNDMTLSAWLVKGRFVATCCPSEGIFRDGNMCTDGRCFLTR
jgi:hypothetical protein